MKMKNIRNSIISIQKYELEMKIKGQYEKEYLWLW